LVGHKENGGGNYLRGKPVAENWEKGKFKKYEGKTNQAGLIGLVQK